MPAASAAPTCTSSTASSREPKLPLVLGHQIVGAVRELGAGRQPSFALGRSRRRAVARVDLRDCDYCTRAARTLCDRARFTGYDIDGGFAEQHRRRRALLLPAARRYPDLQAAPLLCAGLDRISAHCAHRRRPTRVGLYGFGAAAHIIASGRRASRPRGLRLHPAGRRLDAGLRALARRRMGGRFGRTAAGAARRGDHLRAGRCARARRARVRRRKGGTVVCARDPHERHPVVPL